MIERNKRKNSQFGYTFGAIKPETYKNRKADLIYDTLKLYGFEIVIEKFLRPSQEQIQKHYDKNTDWFIKVGKGDESIGRIIYQKMLENMIGNPFNAMILYGKNAVKGLKEITGDTEPSKANIGTIRNILFPNENYITADEENRPILNGFHCSDSEESFQRESLIWFSKEELMPLKLGHLNVSKLETITI